MTDPFYCLNTIVNDIYSHHLLKLLIAHQVNTMSSFLIISTVILPSIPVTLDHSIQNVKSHKISSQQNSLKYCNKETYMHSNITLSYAIAI